MFQNRSGNVDEILLKKVIYGISCRNYEEVAEDILDSLQSVVFDQAENRMHLQKALLLTLMGD